MNACPAMTFSANEFPQSYSESKFSFVLEKNHRSPASEQIWDMTESLYTAAFEGFQEGAKAGLVTDTAIIRNAFILVTLLAPTMPVTDAYISPVGSLVFDWDEDNENMISIILLAGNRVGWAAYFSGDRVHGSANFGGKLPEELAGAISKWRRRTSDFA